MDETTAPGLAPGRRTTKTGYLWALARDDRPWGGAEPFAYLKATLTAIANGHPQSDIDDLLPWNFKQSS